MTWLLVLCGADSPPQAWRKSGARPLNMPSGPASVYKEFGWQGWGYFLGACRAPSNFTLMGVDFVLARSSARTPNGAYVWAS